MKILRREERAMVTVLCEGKAYAQNDCLHHFSQDG